jgi:hypothetical protein
MNVPCHDTGSRPAEGVSDRSPCQLQALVSPHHRTRTSHAGARRPSAGPRGTGAPPLSWATNAVPTRLSPERARCQRSAGWVYMVMATESGGSSCQTTRGTGPAMGNSLHRNLPARSGGVPPGSALAASSRRMKPLLKGRSCPVSSLRSSQHQARSVASGAVSETCEVRGAQARTGTMAAIHAEQCRREGGIGGGSGMRANGVRLSGHPRSAYSGVHRVARRGCPRQARVRRHIYARTINRRDLRIRHQGDCSTSRA